MARERLRYDIPTGAKHVPCPECGTAPATVNGAWFFAAHRNNCPLRTTAIVAIPGHAIPGQPTKHHH